MTITTLTHGRRSVASIAQPVNFGGAILHPVTVRWMVRAFVWLDLRKVTLTVT